MLRHGCAPGILQTLRLSASAPVDLCHSRRRPHTIRFGHATAWNQWPASSYLAKPKGVAGAAAITAAAVGNLASAATPTSTTTTTTTRSINIGASASAGAGATGSTARVTGVSEATAAGGGGDSSNRRQYWAPDGDTKEAFVAEPGPAQNTKVGENGKLGLTLGCAC